MVRILTEEYAKWSLEVKYPKKTLVQHGRQQQNLFMGSCIHIQYCRECKQLGIKITWMEEQVQGSEKELYLGDNQYLH